MPADAGSPLDFDALLRETNAAKRDGNQRDEANFHESRPGRRDGVPDLPAGLDDPHLIDIESARESLFSGLAIFSLLIAFLFLMLGTGHYSKYSHHFNPALWPGAFYLIPFPLVAGGIFFWLRQSTDDHHRLHLRSGKLEYRSSFFGRTFDRTVCRRGEIERVVISEAVKSSKHSHWTEYTVRLITRRGDSLQAASSTKSHGDAIRNARALAAALEADFAG